MSLVWNCAMCGIPYPGRAGWCDCETRVVYRMDGDRQLHETKLLEPAKCPHDNLAKLNGGDATGFKIECVDCGSMFSAATSVEARLERLESAVLELNPGLNWP
jgi:hypothetical protein